MRDAQTWDPDRYARNARFVSDLGMPVVKLLSPQPGERILDLGCGDGVLTRKLVDLGCDVVGVDGSALQVQAARSLGLEARVMDGQALEFEAEFDAVFSNAALHWMKRPDHVIGGVWRALKPDGRFVAEFGGAGCVARIRAALLRSLESRALDVNFVSPWYFPNAEEYGSRLRAGGFQIKYIALIPRRTPLPGEIRAWLETFAETFISAVPSCDRDSFINEVCEALRQDLWDGEKWVADYVRLRFAATKDSTALE